ACCWSDSWSTCGARSGSRRRSGRAEWRGCVGPDRSGPSSGPGSTSGRQRPTDRSPEAWPPTRRAQCRWPRRCPPPPSGAAAWCSTWTTTTRPSRTSSGTSRRCTGGRPADLPVADPAGRLREVYRQDTADIRFDWGTIGAAAIAPGADVMVVVDVLSFTTTLSVAVDSGVEVFPYRFRDASAATFAASKSAVLAVGRSERFDDEVSLSPLSVRTAAEPGGVLDANPRLVLPSPNGSAICRQLAETGTTVVGACLRNAPAVASWIREQRFDVVGVVAAGERWPGELLRPAVEDLWGAGAVIAGLTGSLSPEAGAAAAAWAAAAPASGDNE